MGYGFSISQFAWNMLVFVAAPTFVAAVIIGVIARSERGRPTGRGALGRWGTGALAAVLGFLSCGLWLGWSAETFHGFQGWGLPAPKEFPTWQVLACGATVVASCFLAAFVSKWVVSGGFAASAGTAAGFTTAFTVDASRVYATQEGVGLFLSIVGWNLGLGLLMLIRAGWWSRRRRRRDPHSDEQKL